MCIVAARTEILVTDPFLDQVTYAILLKHRDSTVTECMSRPDTNPKVLADWLQHLSVRGFAYIPSLNVEVPIHFHCGWPVAGLP